MCNFIFIFIAALCVVGNKIDLPKELRAVSTEHGKDFARSLNAVFAETSAAHDIGMCVSLCRYICLCVHACLSVCTCVCVKAHTCVSVHVCVRLSVSICAYMHACVCVHE